MNPDGAGRREPGRARVASLLLVAFALSPVPFALSPVPSRDAAWTVLLSGDADGLLAPCGCTSPQQGGIKRRTTALRQGGERRIVLDNGGLGGGVGTQGRMKAETAAEALRLVKADAANLTGRDAEFDLGNLLNLARLTGGRVVSTSLKTSGTDSVTPWREAGPFLVGGAVERTDLLARRFHAAALAPAEAAHRLTEQALLRGLAPILLFDGDREAARALARAEPALRLVTYRATGHPPSQMEREGDCALAAPGEHGKGVVRLAWGDGAFRSAAVEDLGPEVRDDPEAAALFRRYLKRVSDAGLLEKSPHVSPDGFAGSEKCGSCHAEALRVWRTSDHAHALRTLENVGQDRDPDCVRCHVVGRDAAALAYASRAATPSLANVGCESCHGAGAAHARAPKRVRLPKVGSSSCAPCHTLDNSPRFDFATYWAKVRHGKTALAPSGKR